MGKQIVAIIGSIIVTCIIIGGIGYLTGFNMGELIVSGFGSLKYAFQSIFGR